MYVFWIGQMGPRLGKACVVCVDLCCVMTGPCLKCSQAIELV